MGLDTVELVYAIESEFGITISDDDAASLERVGQIHSFVVHSLAHRGESVDRDEIFERLKRIFTDQFCIPSKDVVPDAHIAYDLGMD